MWKNVTKCGSLEAELVTVLLNEAVNNYFQENCGAVSVRQSIVKFDFVNFFS